MHIRDQRSEQCWDDAKIAVLSFLGGWGVSVPQLVPPLLNLNLSCTTVWFQRQEP